MAPRNYGCNRIVPASDDPVIGSHQSLRASSRDYYVAETPILSITFVGRLSAGFFANRVGVELKMRWFGHVLARLAIAATCTSSAAALDAQVGAANNLPPLIVCGSISLNSSGSLNGLAKRYGVPNRKLRIALRENSSTTHQNRAWAPPLDLADIKSSPAITPTMTRADRQNTGTWPSIFTFLTEGLALYGASCGALVSGIATSPTEASARRPEKSSPCERRKFISIVSPQRVLG